MENFWPSQMSVSLIFKDIITNQYPFDLKPELETTAEDLDHCFCKPILVGRSYNCFCPRNGQTFIFET